MFLELGGGGDQSLRQSSGNQQAERTRSLGMLVLDEASLCPLKMIDHLAATFRPRLAVEGRGNSNMPNWHAKFPFALVPLVIVMADPMQKQPSPTQGISLYEWKKMFRIFPPHPECPSKVKKRVFGDLRRPPRFPTCGGGTNSLDDCYNSRMKALNDWPDNKELEPPNEPTAGRPPDWRRPSRRRRAGCRPRAARESPEDPPAGTRYTVCIFYACATTRVPRFTTDDLQFPIVSCGSWTA